MSEWVQRIDSVNFASCNLDGFSSVDYILTTEILTAADIVTEVKKNRQNSASHEKNLQEEEEDDSEEQEIEVNVPTINEAFQAIRVVHNFYEATSEIVQLI